VNLDRLLDRARHPDAASALRTSDPAGDLDSLAGHRYLLLVSFRADGTAVPTPLWFASGPDCLYASTAADSAKVKRIARNPRVRVAPCSARGRPLGPALAARAERASAAQGELAEAALASRHGRFRRLYRRFAASSERAYLIIHPILGRAGEGAGPSLPGS
jgi:uncharacterized protein